MRHFSPRLALLGLLFLPSCLFTDPAPAVPGTVGVGGGSEVSSTTDKSSGSSSDSVDSSGDSSGGTGDSIVADATQTSGGGISSREDSANITFVITSWQALYDLESDPRKNLTTQESPKIVAMPLSGRIDLAFLVQGWLFKLGGESKWVNAPEGTKVRILLHVLERARMEGESEYQSCDAILIENASGKGHNLYVPNLPIRPGDLSLHLYNKYLADPVDCAGGLEPLAKETAEGLSGDPKVHSLGTLQIQEGPVLRDDVLPPLIPPMPTRLPLGPLF